MHDLNTIMSFPDNLSANDKEKEGEKDVKRGGEGGRDCGWSLFDIWAVEVSFLYSTFLDLWMNLFLGALLKIFRTY